MRLLLDTHAFLWEVLDDKRLSTVARQTWDEPTNELLISPVTLWEIAIKVGLGKLQVRSLLKQFFADELVKNQIQLIPISAEHAAMVSTLPPHHRDPFDRLLIAQALCESVPILSVDNALDAYGVRRLW